MITASVMKGLNRLRVAIVVKIFCQKKIQKIQDSCSCVIFDRYCQRFILGRGAGDWAALPPNFDILLTYFHFLKSKFLSRITPSKATPIQSLLY